MTTRVVGASRVAISLATLVLAACGGGGTGGPPPGYTVGGTVAGLSGLGLVLGVNGGDDLTVNADGAFTFTLAAMKGATYEVVVRRQPLGFTDVCTVGNGTGTIRGANVVDVTVSCRAALAGVSLFAGSFVGAAGITSVAADSSGNLYAANSGLHSEILKVAPDGTLSTLAGSANAGYVDAAGADARFSHPWGVAIDTAGTVYVADSGNNAIRSITPSGVVTTLAGSPTWGYADGTGLAAQFAAPTGIALDAAGGITVMDSGNRAIRRITPTGVVTTLASGVDWGGTIAVDAVGNVYAGTLVVTPAGAVLQRSYFAPGSCVLPVCVPALTVDASGTVYAAVVVNGPGPFSQCLQIWAYPPAGGRSLVAGGACGMFQDGTGVGAGFVSVTDLALGAAGVLYAVDSDRVRTITPAAVVTTLAATATNGNADGAAKAARFDMPIGVAVDAAGDVYVADTGNHEIRRISPAGVVATLAGNGTRGGDDGTGTAATFNNPEGVAVDTTGNVYVADSANEKIRKISPAGVVTTLAGSGAPGHADGAGAAASFKSPVCVAVDSTGNVYVADSGNNKIRKISRAGVVTTLAGNGTEGLADGTGAAATFRSPFGVAVDTAGNVYVADAGNREIRKISPLGVVTTLAGDGTNGTDSSVDGTGSGASFRLPEDVAVDTAGNVYAIDSQVIRKISPAGVVTTLAGNVTQGNEDGTGATASFYNPMGVAVDAYGNVYVADTENNEIRRVAPK